MPPQEESARNNESKIPDNYCQLFCRNWLLTIGIKKGQSWTFLSILVFISLILSIICWTYSLYQTENANEVLHHLSLNLLATGLFCLQATKSNNIFNLAEEADQLFIYEDPILKQIYKSYQQKYFTSFIKKYTDFFVALVFIVWAYIVSVNLKLSLFISLDIPPPFMIPFIKSTIFIILMHINELFFVITAILVDVMVLEVFVTFHLQLLANIKTLNKALKRVGPSSQNISKQIHQFVRHHQLILK
ncbi:hypothetical protein O3M35_007365 [Rhynocoris fuscipes]|uniref:Uncharacterized protein n=1 Tax=Rhynocoris fuscipes TaxID=488301 RepID=A0AAW1D967_9HEMI